MPAPAMPWSMAHLDGLPRVAMVSIVATFHVPSCDSYHILPYLIMRLAISHLTISHHTSSYLTIPHHTLPYLTITLAIPFHTPPYLTILDYTSPHVTIYHHTSPSPCINITARHPRHTSAYLTIYLWHAQLSHPHTSLYTFGITLPNVLCPPMQKLVNL